MRVKFVGLVMSLKSHFRDAGNAVLGAHTPRTILVFAGGAAISALMGHTIVTPPRPCVVRAQRSK